MFDMILGEKAAAILLGVVCLNVMLSAISRCLEMIKDKTETMADNKAAEIVSKLAGLSQKAIDIISANRAH